MRRMAALSLAFLCAVAPVAAQTQPRAIARIEREFDDRFMFVTDGGGISTLFQRLDPPVAPDGEIVCELNQCLVALGEISAQRLDVLGSDYDSLRSLIIALKAASDAQRAAQMAPARERTEAMAAWAQARLAVRLCLSASVCNAPGTLLQR